MCFEELMDRISPKLKGISYRIGARCGFLGEDDLYQEAVAYLWQEFLARKLDDKTDSYILQGCYFHLKNYLRKTKRFVPTTISIDMILNREDSPYNDTLYLRDEDPRLSLDFLSNKALAETILNNGLTGREKEILSFYAEGLTTRQIGKRMGVSHVRIVKLTARIREKCRKYLD